MSELEIRRLRSDQIDAAIDVWVRSRWAAQPRLEERMRYSDEQNADYFRNVLAKQCDIWLALEAGQVLGLLALGNDAIEQLYVDPDLQNRGIGTALLSRARQLRPDRLTLFTHQWNENARRFYERRGFTAIRFGASPAPENEPDVQYEWKRE